MSSSLPWKQDLGTLSGDSQRVAVRVLFDGSERHPVDGTRGDFEGRSGVRSHQRGCDSIPRNGPMSAEDDRMELFDLMKEMTRRKMPNTMTFIPHRMKKSFARLFVSKRYENWRY